MPYICYACGYPNLTEPSRSKAGGGSNEICPSCGFEPGYTDDALHVSYEQWRKKWIEDGMIWDRKRTPPPVGWNPKAQLLNVGIKFPEN